MPLYHVADLNSDITPWKSKRIHLWICHQEKHEFASRIGTRGHQPVTQACEVIGDLGIIGIKRIGPNLAHDVLPDPTFLQRRHFALRNVAQIRESLSQCQRSNEQNQCNYQIEELHDAMINDAQ